MNIAELFIQIGVKGGEKVTSALGSVKTGLGNIVSSSLEAKAAMVALFYGIERAFSASGTLGAELKNFNQLTGVSTTFAQQFGIVFKQSNFDAKEALSTITGIQNAMANFKLGIGESPFGLARISEDVGGIDYNQVQDPTYVIKKALEFVRNSKQPVENQNVFLNSIGLGPNAIAALRRFKGEIEDIKRGILGPGEIDALARYQQKWNDFTNELTIIRGRFTENWGMPILGELQGALKLTMSWSKELDTVTKKFPAMGSAAKLAFLAIAGVLALMGPQLLALSATISAIVFLLGEWQKHKDNNKDSIFGDKDFKGNAIESLYGFLKGVSGEGKKDKIGDTKEQAWFRNLIEGSGLGYPKEGLVPNSKGGLNGAPHSYNNNTINNNFSISEANDPQMVAEVVGRHLQRDVNNAFWPNPQGWVA